MPEINKEELKEAFSQLLDNIDVTELEFNTEY